MACAVGEFTEKLSLLRAEGFVPSARRGPTGVGHTLEQRLGFTENNFVIPDLGEVELKATRDEMRNLITLFTSDRDAWRVPQSELIKRFGLAQNDRLNMYVTLRAGQHLRGLFVDVTDED